MANKSMRTTDLYCHFEMIVSILFYFFFLLRFSRPLLIRIAKNAMVVGLNCDRIVHDLCYTVFVWLLVRSCSQIVFSLPKKCVCVLVVAFVYNRFACTVFATHTHKNRSASPILKQNEALSMPGPMSHAINKLNYFDENTLLFFSVAFVLASGLSWHNETRFDARLPNIIMLIRCSHAIVVGRCVYGLLLCLPIQWLT